MNSSRKGFKKMKKKKGPTNRPALRLEGSEPPPFEINTIISKKVRYIFSTASTVGAITYTSLRSAIVVGTGAGAATSTVLFANSIRVKKIEMWGPMVAALTPVSVSCQFVASLQAGAAGAPPKIHSDTSMGMRAAHVKVHPPEGSLQSEWIANVANTDVFMNLIGPVNTVVDITYDIVPVWTSINPGAGAATIAANITGVIYWRTLDNAGFLVPVVGFNNV
jgi:hypothetical protein